MAKKKRGSRWLTQAALQTLVRFGPEESGLKAAERQAQDTYASTVAGAEATRKGITKAVAYARPKVVKSYDDAGLQFARARDVAAPAVAGGSPTIQAAVAAEQAGFTARLGESKANTLTEFDQRRVDAVSGAAYARKGARETLGSDLAKLFTRSQDLQREKGAFTIATAQQLKQAAQQRADTLANQQANRDVTERGQTLSHKDRVATRRAAKIKEAAKPPKSGLGSLPPKDEVKLSDKVKFARDFVKEARAAGAPEGAIRTALRLGQPLKQGGEVMFTPHAAHEPELVQAGFELAATGHLSAATVKALHERGLHIPGSWRPRRGGRTPNRPVLAPGPNGQLRPN